jgi:hypothetical protein
VRAINECLLKERIPLTLRKSCQELLVLSLKNESNFLFARSDGARGKESSFVTFRVADRSAIGLKNQEMRFCLRFYTIVDSLTVYRKRLR